MTAWRPIAEKHRDAAFVSYQLRICSETAGVAQILGDDEANTVPTC